MKIKAVIQNTLTYDLNGYKDEGYCENQSFIQQLIFQTNIEGYVMLLVCFIREQFEG